MSAEYRFVVAPPQHFERAQVQLFGTAPVVDHSRLCAQLARVGLTHVCLTIGSSLGLVVGGCDGLPEPGERVNGAR